MKTIKYLLVAVFFGVLAGCELTGEAGDDRVVHKDNGTVSGEVSGRAVKGVLGNALVQAYAMEEGGLRWLEETLTDEQGFYSLSLSGVRGPVLLEVTRTTGAAMRCDAVSGCGASAFGEDTGLSEGFRLSSIVQTSEIGEKQVAITPLTHLASEWGQSFDAVPSAEEIRLARSRVAGVLSVAPDFALRNVPDISSEEEMGGSDPASAGLAVMGGAFMEAAGQWGEGFLDELSHRFNAHAGQLPQTGSGANLGNLLDAAVRVARGARGNEALSSIAASLEYRRDHLQQGFTDFQEPMMESESRAFVAARKALLGLTAGLNDFGINERGDFMRRRQEEIAWLANSNTAEILQGLGIVSAGTLLVSALGDVVEGLPIHFSDPMTLHRYYPENRMVLIFDGELDGMDLDLQIEMPMARQVLAEKEPLQFHTKGRISKGEMTLHVDTDVVMDPLDSNPMPMVVAMDTAMIAGTRITLEEFLHETEHYFRDLRGVTRLDGNYRFSSLEGSYRELSADIGMSLEVDLRNRNGEADIVEARVDRFDTADPHGHLFAQPDDAPLFTLRLEDDLEITGAVEISEYGQPLAGIRHAMTLRDVGGQFSEGTVEARPVPSAINGEAVLDFPLHSDRYRLTHDGGDFSVSRSHSGETAFVVRNIGPGGGVLYAGEELIGTVAVDAKIGLACFLLLDGTRECLSPGLLGLVKL